MLFKIQILLMCTNGIKLFTIQQAHDLIYTEIKC